MRYIMLLQPTKLHEHDIEITRQPTYNKAGKARIVNAIVGPKNPDPDAIISLPLISRSGECVGFIEEPTPNKPPRVAPFIHYYEIEEEIGNNMKQCMVILFPDKLRDFDISVTQQPTHDEPGKARILNAIVGPQRPDAPNSLPLISCSEEYIGFVARPS